MTTTAPSPASSPVPVLDVSGTKPIPFGRLVGVELRKTYDTRAGFWLLAAIGILVVLAETIVLVVAATNDSADLDFGAFVGVAAFLTSVLLPILGIMLVTGEWGQRTAMVTFALEPRRPRVIAAKYVVGLVLTLMTALGATVVGAFCNAILGLVTGSADWTFGWNYFFGFLVLQSLAMTSGFALAALLLNTPAAIVVFIFYQYVIPVIFGIASYYLSWFDGFSQWIDFRRAQGPIADLTLSGAKAWGQLLTSGLLWLVVPLGLGLRRILRAEMK